MFVAARPALFSQGGTRTTLAEALATPASGLFAKKRVVVHSGDKILPVDASVPVRDCGEAWKVIRMERELKLSTHPHCASCMMKIPCNMPKATTLKKKMPCQSRTAPEVVSEPLNRATAAASF